VFIKYALKKNMNKIKKDLADFGVNFDVWFSEQSLYDNGEIMETINFLKEQGHTGLKHLGLELRRMKYW